MLSHAILDFMVRRYGIEIESDGSISYILPDGTRGFCSHPVDPGKVIEDNADDIIDYINNRDAIKAADLDAEYHCVPEMIRNGLDILAPYAIDQMPPILYGSPKQINWAIDIRKRAFDALKYKAAHENRRKEFIVLFYGKNAGNALWWIDNRSASFDNLL